MEATWDPQVEELLQKKMRADRAREYKKEWMRGFRGHGDKEKARTARLMSDGRCVSCEIFLHLQPGHNCMSAGKFED